MIAWTRLNAKFKYTLLVWLKYYSDKWPGQCTMDGIRTKYLLKTNPQAICRSWEYVYEKRKKKCYVKCITVKRRSSLGTLIQQSHLTSTTSLRYIYYIIIPPMNFSRLFAHSFNKTASSKSYFVHAHYAQQHDDHRRIRKVDGQWRRPETVTYIGETGSA